MLAIEMQALDSLLLSIITFNKNFSFHQALLISIFIIFKYSYSSNSQSFMDRILGVCSSGKPDTEERLQNWSIPKVDVSKVYSKSPFPFIRDSSIRTFEHTMILRSSNQTLFLLSRDSKLRHRNKKNQFLHYGLVQVAVKPLHGLGQDSPILLCLYDSRLLSFEQSLLATVESNLHSGPVYFNYRTTYPVSATDPHLLKTLTLNIQTQNIDFQENSHSLALTYRVYYKVTDQPLYSKTRRSSSSRETEFYEGDFLRSNAFIRRTTYWDPVISSSNWNLPPEQTESRSNSQAFITEEDGTVKVRFV